MENSFDLYDFYYAIAFDGNEISEKSLYDPIKLFLAKFADFFSKKWLPNEK